MKSLIVRVRALGPWRASLVFGLVVALAHLSVAGRVPLTADEAHYALYGLHLDWSYFDHPPMVGWLQSLVLLFSSSELALRLWPIALSTLSAWTLFFLTRQLFPGESPWTGFVAVALFEAGILFHAIGLALVPETPLLFFSLLTVLALVRAVDRDRWRDWILFGLCIGLAGLSKYTAITLVISAVGYILLQRGWSVLTSAGFWMALMLSGLVALVFIAPVLYWNADHDWISIRYQLEHGYRAKEWAWWRVGLSQTTQAFAYSPAVYFFGLIALVAGFRQWRERGTQVVLLLVIPILLLFLSASGREESLPHWTAVAWAGLLPLMARWLINHWDRRAVRFLLFGSAVYSIVLVLLFHFLLWFPSLPLPGKRHPLYPVVGWPEAAQRAAALRTELEKSEPGAVLLVPNWSLASRLAWYARPLPVQVTDERFDQFDLWFGTPRAGTDGIVVVPDYLHRNTGRMVERFESCREAEPMPVAWGERVVVTFRFYICRNYRDQPAANP